MVASLGWFGVLASGPVVAQTAAEGRPAQAEQPSSLTDGMESGSTNASKSRYILRREAHEARRQQRAQADAERATRTASAQASAQSPAPAPGRDAAPERPQPVSQPVTAPAAADEVKVTFKLASGSAKSKETDWTPAGIFKASLRAGEAITLDARVEGRDAKGQPVPIVAEWQPADHGSVQVTPAGTGVVRITVRGRGESNLTVVGPGFSKELWLSATTQGETVQLQISQ